MSPSIKSFYFLFYFFIIGLLSCNTNDFAQGKKLYTKYCSNCHADDGSGLNLLIPPISNSDYYINNQDKISCIIKFGIKDTILVNGKKFNQSMVGINMSPVQITNLINYMNSSWGYKLPIKKYKDIKLELEQCIIPQ